MKKILTLSLAILSAAVTMAQVDVTYQVDITEYLASGEVLAAAGMRVGGDFAVNSATNGSDAMMDWTPSDAFSALSDEGSNVWSITVTYPASAIGSTQSFKFVNGDWGMNEGSTVMVDDGCAIDDGGGNVNRQLVVPANPITLRFCYDSCFQCDGSSPELATAISVPAAGLENITVAPTPATTGALISFDALGSVDYQFVLTNTVGQVVATQQVNSEQVFIARNNLPAGMYFATLRNAEGNSATVRVLFR